MIGDKYVRALRGRLERLLPSRLDPIDPAQFDHFFAEVTATALPN
jgi:hypothetical protein